MGKPGRIDEINVKFTDNNRRYAQKVGIQFMHKGRRICRKNGGDTAGWKNVSEKQHNYDKKFCTMEQSTD